MDDREDVDQEGVLCRHQVLWGREVMERDLPRERLLDVDLEWCLGHFGGLTGDCRTGRTGAGGSRGTGGGGSMGAADTGSPAA